MSGETCLSIPMCYQELLGSVLLRSGEDSWEEWMLKYHMHFTNSGNYTQRDFKTKQSTYAMIGCQQGLGASLFNPSSRSVAQLVKVRMMKRLGHWEDVHIPHSIRAILCLNLPSFSGGLNPWGIPNNKGLH
ncbi:hypothetical protein RJ640_013441 [Escallonia rubra]|uniref:Diacylglycerol kinase accessory domain-containing protein n=1 Tax=Escallonia rubra TaxID=112253 RepID=A0AA88QRM8_9ASTE|nr:hypothetical protein RJ640_013441 [Escallonia rubra]